ncbi:MAG: Fic family protein, partial [Bifidobacteriaceae bacterium]|nr:Fic family protein [Bifidobacteriaceae bacterium]
MVKKHIDNPIFEEFANSQARLQEFGGLPSVSKAADIWDEIWMVEAHNSTGIEGNTLALSDVKEFLEIHKTSGGKKIKEYMEVLSYADAAKWVYSQARNPVLKAAKNDIITLTELRNIHQLLMKLVWEIDPPHQLLEGETAGSFRKHDIKRFGDGMKPPDFMVVPSLISAWLKSTNKMCNEYLSGEIKPSELPEKLAQIHQHFESIHPFRDGNGRTGRLVLNLILVRLGFPPCIILKTRRVQYLKSLQLADKENYYKLGIIIARGVLDNIYRFIIPDVMQDTSLVPL